MFKLDRSLKFVLREGLWARQHAPDELELGSKRFQRGLPDRWAASNPEHVRQFCREEKADRRQRAAYMQARRRIEQRHRQSENSGTTD